MIRYGLRRDDNSTLKVYDAPEWQDIQMVQAGEWKPEHAQLLKKYKAKYCENKHSSGVWNFRITTERQCRTERKSRTWGEPRFDSGFLLDYPGLINLFFDHYNDESELGQRRLLYAFQLIERHETVGVIRGMPPAWSPTDQTEECMEITSNVKPPSNRKVTDITNDKQPIQVRTQMKQEVTSDSKTDDDQKNTVTNDVSPTGADANNDVSMSENGGFIDAHSYPFLYDYIHGTNNAPPVSMHFSFCCSNNDKNATDAANNDDCQKVTQDEVASIPVLGDPRQLKLMARQQELLAAAKQHSKTREQEYDPLRVKQPLPPLLETPNQSIKHFGQCGYRKRSLQSHKVLCQSLINVCVADIKLKLEFITDTPTLRLILNHLNNYKGTAGVSDDKVKPLCLQGLQLLTQHGHFQGVFELHDFVEQFFE